MARKTHKQYVNECIEKDFDLPLEKEDNIYVNTHKKLLYKCKNNHIYKQTSNNHLCGKSCFKCGIISTKLKRTKTHEQYINECVEKDFDLPLEQEDNIYTNTHIKLLHLCRKNNNHQYKQTPHSHLQGSSCPQCNDYRSQELFRVFLQEIFDTKFDTAHLD